jgi:hypothetical protein
VALVLQPDPLWREQTRDRLIGRDRAASRPFLDARAQEVGAQFVTGSGAVHGVHGGDIDHLRNAVLPYESSEVLRGANDGWREKHGILQRGFEMGFFSVN